VTEILPVCRYEKDWVLGVLHPYFCEAVLKPVVSSQRFKLTGALDGKDMHPDLYALVQHFKVLPLLVVRFAFQLSSLSC